MNFSITLASRSRVGLLTQLLWSINEVTHNLNEVEVLIGIDNDDHETCQAADGLSSQYPFARFFRRDRSHMLNRDYINWTYQIAGSGKYIIACNDDAAFRTVGWDDIIMKRMDDYLRDKPDRIAYGRITDEILNHFGMEFCCFPLVTREGYETLGWVMPPEFPSWNADIVCWRTYNAVGRVCDIRDIMIEHISYHAGKRERDEISFHVERIACQGTHHGIDINVYIQRLQQRIAAAAS